MITRDDLSITALSELSLIAPGEICIYRAANPDGFSPKTIRLLSELNRLKNGSGMRMCCDIMVRSTENNLLIDHIVARRSTDTGDTYPIYISTDKDLYGLLNKVWGFMPNEKVYAVSTGTTEPEEIWMTSGDNTTTGAVDTDGESTGPCQDCPYVHAAYGRLLRTSAPSQQDVKQSIASSLSDCVQYGYEIDLDGIVNKIKAEKEHKDQYYLDIEYGRMDRRYTKQFLSMCDIFIVDGSSNTKYKLNLNAMEKAVYLTFISYGDGILLESFTKSDCLDEKREFMHRMQQIYSMMPGQQKMHTFRKTLMTKVDPNQFKYGTLKGYLTDIRACIQEQISYSPLVDEFAVEGYKDKEYKVQRTNDKIREFVDRILNDSESFMTI